MTKTEIEEWIKLHANDKVDYNIECDDGNSYETIVYKINDKLFAIYRCNGVLSEKWSTEKGYTRDEYEIVRVKKHTKMIEVVTYIPNR